MTLKDSEKLAHYVRSLPDFVLFETIDGNYKHIGATVADAILQANNNYKTHVKPRVNRILAQYPSARTTSSIQSLLRSVPAAEFLGWRGIDRAQRFSRVFDLFAAEGIENEEDLREWLSLDSNLPRLRAIKGIGPKTIDYFKILVGMSTSAIDRHLLSFLELAGLAPCSYLDAQSIINATADILRIDRAYFDHSIWQFMSKRAKTSQHGKCPGHRG